ncbi:MAG: DMT family transporter, partial [Pseudomonadota bacterium]
GVDGTLASPRARVARRRGMADGFFMSLDPPSSPATTPADAASAGPEAAEAREAPGAGSTLIVLAAVFGLSLKGILAKFALAAGMGVMALVLARMMLAWPLFWGVEKILRRAAPAKASAGDAARASALGGLFLVAAITDFQAIDKLGAALSRIVLFTYPLAVILVGAAARREAPGRRGLIAFAVAFPGLVLVLGPGAEALGPNFWPGVGYAAASALSIGSYFALSQNLMRRMGAPAFTMVSQGAATLGMAAVGALTLGPEDFAFGPEGWAWIAAIVVFATVAPILAFYEGIRRLGAARASLISLVGPLMTATMAWIFLDETLGPVQLLGFAVVLGAIGWLELGKARGG